FLSDSPDKTTKSRKALSFKAFGDLIECADSLSLMHRLYTDCGKPITTRFSQSTTGLFPDRYAAFIQTNTWLSPVRTKSPIRVCFHVMITSNHLLGIHSFFMLNNTLSSNWKNNENSTQN